MTNNIVNLNVTQTVAPAPSTLQQTGVFVSFGGTTAAANSLTLLTQASSLTSQLATPLALTSLVFATGTVTATTAAAHGLTTGSYYWLSVQGALPTGYNGMYLCYIVSTTTFQFTLASNPGSMTTAGTWAPASFTELQAMNTTFWAQGANTPVYVLELGVQPVNTAPTALNTWIVANPKTVYAYLVPRWFDNPSGTVVGGNAASPGSQTAFLAVVNNYSSPTSMTYFFVTTTNTTYSAYTVNGVRNKCVYTTIEAPSVNPVNEFDIAADFYQVIMQNPSSTNKVGPLAFRFVYGVTAYPTVGMSSTFASWKAAGVNWKGTGYEGGIATAIIFWGTTMDGNPFNYWYAVDWLQINIDLDIANAVINGSNNPINPLALDQDGINTLQAVGAGTLGSGVTFGLLLGTVVQAELSGPALATALDAGTYAGQALINAVPFQSYYAANPSDYANGVYNGFSVTCTPLRGFASITFNVNVTNFVA
jgi:hypothetical protein